MVHYRILVKYLPNHKPKETLKIKTKQREYLLNLVQGIVNLHLCVCSLHTWYYSIIWPTVCSFNIFIQYIDGIPYLVLDTGDADEEKQAIWLLCIHKNRNLLVISVLTPPLILLTLSSSILTPTGLAGLCSFHHILIPICPHFPLLSLSSRVNHYNHFLAHILFFALWHFLTFTWQNLILVCLVCLHTQSQIVATENNTKVMTSDLKCTLSAAS